MEKVDGPTTLLHFQGLLLGSVHQEICLPPGKLQELLTELQQLDHKKKATKCQLLSLIGKLAFAARAVPAGWLFVRRLICLSTTVTHVHHQIRLNTEARADIRWWLTILPSWNGTAKFVDPDLTNALDWCFSPP